MRIWINGQFFKKEEACISVFDHGLLYGDGVFEGIRAYSGNSNGRVRRYVFALNEHLRRLWRSASGIGLEIPLAFDEMREAVLKVFAQSEEVNYVRLLLTRGVGDLGISPKSCSEPNIIIIPNSWKRYYPEEKYKQGLRVIVARTHNKPRNVLSPNIKSLNYLPNILARIEARKAGVDEALMLNEHEQISEGCVDNLFLVKDDFLLLTPPSQYILEGITRQAIRKIAGRLGMRVSEAIITTENLYQAQELFLCGTAAEVIGVVEVNGQSIGEGKPGPITQRIAAEFKKYASEPQNGVPVPGLQMAMLFI